MVDWLLHHPSYPAPICRLHGYAVDNLSGHLLRHHRDLSTKLRAKIVSQYAGVCASPSVTVNAGFRHGPDNPLPLVDGLTIHTDSFACRELECRFMTTSWKCLRVHFNEAHNRHGADIQGRWSSVTLQTFFSRPRSRINYFCVATDEGNKAGSSIAVAKEPTQQRLVEGITARWAHATELQKELQQVLAAGVNKHETSNWLRRTQWVEHFENRNLLLIESCSRMLGSKINKELERLSAAFDRLFFDRCISGLKTMPLMTKLLLASPHHNDAHSRPFGPLQEKKSMERYLSYWKRLLYYCLNVQHLDDGALWKQHGFCFTVKQRQSLGVLGAHLADKDWPETELEEELLQVSVQFWTQRLEGDPFISPLWHFVGVLAIDADLGQFRPPHLFTYVLAGLVYVGRALLSEWAIPSLERSKIEDLGDRFDRVRTAWLCKASYSPMGYILSLLLYGRRIAQETGSRLMVSWSRENELMYFMGRPILMEDIRSMVAKMTVDSADLLWDSLMFKEGDDVRFTIPLERIEDDLTQTQRGQSFIHSNGLAGKECEMLKDLVSGRRRNEFLDASGEWKWNTIQAYRKQVTKFLEMLIVLVQMTWGQPARGEEVTGLRLVNGINRDRNIFIIDGQVVLVSQYHKSQAHFDSPKVIPRFLPDHIGQLIIAYIVYIRPLTDRWEAEHHALCGTVCAPSDFIWSSGTSPQQSSWMSQAMAKWTQHYIGRSLSLQPWRHVAIAISRKLARQQGLTQPDFEDEEDDESEHYEVPDDLAAGHTSQTAAKYGVTIDVLKKLSADSLETFRAVSYRWHRFLGLATTSSRAQPQKRICEGSSALPVPMKRPRILPLQPASNVATNDHILSALRSVLRDNGARFRSAQQEEAVRMACARESPLVVILPTGGGKSQVFMVPAMLRGAGITIVVAPYAALKNQLVTRCLDAGLDCKPWPEARNSWPRLVLISAEAASGDDFLQWAADACTRGAVERIVVDECHLCITAADNYRRRLRSLVLLRQLGRPMVFLTGTLPPLRQREFEEAMQLQNPYYIRASSHHINVRYSVTHVQNGRGLMEVRKLVLARQSLLKVGEKGVIYCSSKAKCQVLARQLNCHYYHSASYDGDAQFLAQRDAGFQAWIRGDMPYIVATAALGTGIDIAGITHVIHLEAPNSIIDYAQEAGRAGRGGEHVVAEIFVEEKDLPPADDVRDSCLEVDAREVNRLIRAKGCRRSIMGQCLDNDVRSCQQIDIKAVLCDNCEREDRIWRSEASSQGLIMAKAHARRVARGLERLEIALEEVQQLGQLGCRICWMFEGRVAALGHQWTACPRIDEKLTFLACMDFQRQIDYRRDRQAQFLSCFYCHVSQEICVDGYRTKGATCQAKHAVIPVALAAETEDSLWPRVQELAGKEIVGGAAYAEWLGRKHRKLVCGQEMTNAMAVFNLVLEWRAERATSGG